MLIKTRLAILLSAVVALVLISASVTFVTYLKREEVQKALKEADELNRAMFDVNQLAMEFMLQPGKRVRNQWEQKLAGLHKGLEASRSRQSIGPEVLSEIDVRLASLARIFDKLANLETLAQRANHERVRRILAGQLLGQTEYIVRLATRHAESVRESAENRESFLIFLLIGTALLLMSAFAVAGLVVSKQVLRPLFWLCQEVQRLGKGDFSSPFHYAANDEIGSLVEQIENSRGELLRTRKRDQEQAEALREREEKLRVQTKELMRSNRDLDDFAYIASHDLKSPLRGIEQLVGFIEEDCGKNLPPESQKHLALLRRRTKRLTHLLKGLLQYSRIGREERSAMQVDLSRMVGELVDLYLPADFFSIHTPVALPTVYLPEPAVELVLRNLLMNAVKHHDRGVGEISITWNCSSHELVIDVCDDGPGIPFEYNHRIFELFQTLRPRDKVEGSGMGLSLVRKSMEVLGGTVELLPGSDRGATFRLVLPAAVIVETAAKQAS